MRAAWALVVIAACGSRGPGLDRERAAAAFTRISVDTAGVHGLSGLAVAADGTMWTVAERGAAAFAIQLDGDRARATRVAIAGLPPGEDLEAVAIGPDGGLWVGTEGRDAGIARVFRLVPGPDGLAVAGPPLELRQAEVGVDIGANHGAEGVCSVDGVVVAAIETAGRDARGRWAPIATIDPATGARTMRRLRLTTETGKISALECWREGAARRAWAIERHFAVTRILEFALDGDGDIAPSVVLDLGPILRGSLNLEGIARLADGRMVAVVDNQYRTVTGPDELLLFVGAAAPTGTSSTRDSTGR